MKPAHPTFAAASRLLEASFRLRRAWCQGGRDPLPESRIFLSGFCGGFSHLPCRELMRPPAVSDSEFVCDSKDFEALIELLVIHAAVGASRLVNVGWAKRSVPAQSTVRAWADEACPPYAR